MHWMIWWLSMVALCLMTELCHCLILSQTDHVTDCMTLYESCNKDADNCQLDFFIFHKSCEFWEPNSPILVCPNGKLDQCKSTNAGMKSKWPQFTRCTCPLNLPEKRLSSCRQLREALDDHPCLRPPRPPTEPTPASPPDAHKLPENPPLEKEEKEDLSALADINLSSLPPSLLRTNLRVLLNSLGIFTSSRSSSGQVSCLYRLQNCKDNITCSQLLSQFMTDCTFANCESRGSQCMTIYDKFRRFQTFDCTCSGVTNPFQRQQCVQYQSDIIDNKCLALSNIKVLFQTKPLISDLKDDANVKTIRQDMDCFETYRECLKDSQCLDKYIRLESACQWNQTVGQRSGTCAVSATAQKQCLSALTQFYYRPNPIVHSALICRCPPNSIECTRHKNIFQPLCAYYQTWSINDGKLSAVSGFYQHARQKQLSKSENPKAENTILPNCLALMVQCSADMSCLDTFSIFSEICTPSDSSEGQLSKCRLSSDHCLDVSRALWGGMLTQRCSCHPEETRQLTANRGRNARSDPVEVCKLVRQVIVKPPCIKITTLTNKPVMNEFSDICKWIKQNNISVQSDHVRIYADTVAKAGPQQDWFSSNNLNSGQSNLEPLEKPCDVVVCTCGGLQDQKCKRLPCPTISSGAQAEYQRTGSGMCTYVPPIGRTCRCQDGELTCRLFHPDPGVYMTGHRLSITYDPFNYDLLANHSLALDFHQLGSKSLTYLLHAFPDTAHCRLELVNHRRGSVMYGLVVSAYSDGTMKGEWKDRTTYSRFDESKQKLEKKCVTAMELIRLMISKGYPEIRHDIYLSIFTNAHLIIPPTETPPSSDQSMSKWNQQVNDDGNRRRQKSSGNQSNCLRSSIVIIGLSYIFSMIIKCLLLRT